MKKVELLSPAGDLNRLKAALLYGADAVYVGGRKYSLRANATNLSLEEIKEATDFAHKLGKKVYLTLNIVFHNEDLKEVKDYIKDVVDAGIDAFIVSDISLVKYIKDNFKVEAHISTQNTTNNKMSALFLKEVGADRVVLGRELSLSEIKEICALNIIDTEVFIHGAVCSFYSGRCALSSYFTKRDANRGGCAQVCRFTFKDGDKDFSMASKDMNLSSYIKDLIEAGVTSFKIEGRMRSIYYLATVITSYRMIIDAYYNKTYNEKVLNDAKSYLDRVANRDNTEQFLKGYTDQNDQYYEGRKEETNQDYVLDVLAENKNILKVMQKNYFTKKDNIEIFNYKHQSEIIEIKEILDEEENIVDAARHPKSIYYLVLEKPLDMEVTLYTMGRKI